MTPGTHLDIIAHTIQLSLAPIFVLVACGTILSVLINRLGRVVDRARLLEGRLAAHHEEEENTKLQIELDSHFLRARLTYFAITLSIVCALAICLVVAFMFIGTFMSKDFTTIIVLLFVGAMIAFIGALLTFLREIFIAVTSLRIGNS